MNIQIFGKNKCFDTKKAERYFKERGIRFQRIEMCIRDSRWCIEHAQDGDIIVLAGKGHEDYQEIRGERRHYDEREVIASILADIGKENPSCK